MDTILIKRGNKVGTSFLADGELGYSREEKALYIGDGGRRNQKICSAIEMANLITEMPKKLAAMQMEALPTLDSTTTLADAITAYNALISALKASGVMKEG